MNDKELDAFTDCMESNAFYNSRVIAPYSQSRGLSTMYLVIAEAYLARTETLVNKTK
jgi:hypothetical protein